MSRIRIVNEYLRYCEASESAAFKTNVIECDDNDVIEPIIELCRYPGEYVFEYDYDGKYIKITNGRHTPVGQYMINIDRNWLENDIKNIQSFSLRQKIVNCI